MPPHTQRPVLTCVRRRVFHTYAPTVRQITYLTICSLPPPRFSPPSITSPPFALSSLKPARRTRYLHPITRADYLPLSTCKRNMYRRLPISICIYGVPSSRDTMGNARQIAIYVPRKRVLSVRYPRLYPEPSSALEAVT